MDTVARTESFGCPSNGGGALRAVEIDQVMEQGLVAVLPHQGNQE